jgi:hypothetical protein
MNDRRQGDCRDSGTSRLAPFPLDPHFVTKMSHCGASGAHKAEETCTATGNTLATRLKLR